MRPGSRPQSERPDGWRGRHPQTGEAPRRPAGDPLVGYARLASDKAGPERAAAGAIGTRYYNVRPQAECPFVRITAGSFRARVSETSCTRRTFQYFLSAVIFVCVLRGTRTEHARYSFLLRNMGLRVASVAQ